MENLCFQTNRQQQKRTNRNFAKLKIKPEQSAHWGIQTWPLVSAGGVINSPSPNSVNSQKFILYID